MLHELKTDPKAFKDLDSESKTFEIRKDDRGYQVLDKLLLRETQYTGKEMVMGKPLIYTGNIALRYVSHILRGPIYGLEDGWVIMSVKK